MKLQNDHVQSSDVVSTAESHMLSITSTAPQVDIEIAVPMPSDGEFSIAAILDEADQYINNFVDQFL